MNRPLRIVVAIAAVAGLLALALVFMPARFLPGQSASERLRAAQSLASRTYRKAAPMASLQYWRDWARRQDELASRPQPTAVIIIRHIRQPPNRLAVLELPRANVPQGMVTPSPDKEKAEAAAEFARLHTMAKDFEGCWQGTVKQPETWRYVQGPEPDGWTPATYTVCLRHPGPNAGASVSVDTSIRLVSQWVIPWSGQRNEHTDIVFQSPDQVILRLTGQLPLQLKVLGLLPGPSPTISYSDYFRCSIQDQKLDVIATMTDTCNGSSVENCHGKPWIRQSWHQQLTRISQ